jgi:N utilization substance protein B
MARPAVIEDRKANRRGAARLAAVQALYQMDIAGAGLNEIFAEFDSHWLGREVEGEAYLPAEAAFFRDIVSGVLRAGAYELEHRRDVPARVVVSEYADVANAFVDADETGMVNAVLDQLARQMRGDEIAAR